VERSFAGLLPLPCGLGPLGEPSERSNMTLERPMGNRMERFDGSLPTGRAGERSKVIPIRAPECFPDQRIPGGRGVAEASGDLARDASSAVAASPSGRNRVPSSPQQARV